MGIGGSFLRGKAAGREATLSFLLQSIFSYRKITSTHTIDTIDGNIRFFSLSLVIYYLTYVNAQELPEIA
jgi:hypothetical protein